MKGQVKDGTDWVGVGLRAHKQRIAMMWMREIDSVRIGWVYG